MAVALSAMLERAGHRVTASTTIAGTVETLMRRGASVDLIVTSGLRDSALGYDVIQYGRKFAANARFILLGEDGHHLEDIELAVAREAAPRRPAASAVHDAVDPLDAPDWN